MPILRFETLKKEGVAVNNNQQKPNENNPRMMYF
tara:strand:- start:1569 stop:1670 length:102 start_codon:yes stop_codon:yes gene_type:complete